VSQNRDKVEDKIICEFFISTLELDSKPQIMFEDKAQVRRKSTKKRSIHNSMWAFFVGAKGLGPITAACKAAFGLQKWLQNLRLGSRARRLQRSYWA
jgi:hypothetical protein